MLSKVRARHGIDLPVEKWGRNTGLAFALGSLAILFIVAPVVAIAIRGFVEHPALTGIGVASGLVALYALAIFTRT